MKIKILIPIYNDWQSVQKLIKDIDILINDLPHDFSIFIINDGSTDNKPDTFGNVTNINSLKFE